jgi:hypothetical protein
MGLLHARIRLGITNESNFTIRFLFAALLSYSYPNNSHEAELPPSAKTDVAK